MQQYRQIPATRPATKKRTSQVSPAVQLKQLKRRERSDLPDPLRDGIEQLSGLSMAGVRVHRNSAAPAQLGAHAYAQGRDIHLAPGQDHHLPHEAWHVVQQAQGRVATTTSSNGVAVNDNPALEREADQKGAEAAQLRANPSTFAPKPLPWASGMPAQCKASAAWRHLHDHMDTGRTVPAIINTDRLTTGGYGPFITGKNAARHHIISRSILRGYAQNMSNLCAAVQALKNHCADPASNLAIRKAFGDKLDAIQRFGASMGLNENGIPVGNELRSKFYWAKGAIFIGISPDNRTHDPGEGQETVQPRSMETVYWDRAKNLSRTLEIIREFHNDISHRRTGNYNSFIAAEKALVAVQRATCHSTSDLRGEDWTLSTEYRSRVDYTAAWGMDRRAYRLSEGQNDYEALPENRNMAAMDKTLSRERKRAFSDARTLGDHTLAAADRHPNLDVYKEVLWLLGSRNYEAAWRRLHAFLGAAPDASPLSIDAMREYGISRGYLTPPPAPARPDPIDDPADTTTPLERDIVAVAADVRPPEALIPDLVPRHAPARRAQGGGFGVRAAIIVALILSFFVRSAA